LLFRHKLFLDVSNVSIRECGSKLDRKAGTQRKRLALGLVNIGSP
jgi:hypothetical protein